ncbi:MAG: hypothetical protein COA78_29365 [Blastopirellula sp.]|nr:MAG: hypothetical protein COA78_29365 [Blastopirellula sp.]
MVHHILRCLLTVTFLCRVGLSQESSEPTVQIKQGAIDVSLEKISNNDRALKASVRVSYELHNTSDKPENVTRLFPVSAPIRGFGPHIECRVLVNGVSVQSETKPVIEDPGGLIPGFRYLENWVEWKSRIESWIEQDAELDAMVTKYRKLRTDNRDYADLIEEFNTRIKKHLIHVSDNKYVALDFAKGRTSISHLIRLMPEVDPKYRIDEPYKRWQYVSLLNTSYKHDFSLYENEWRDQAEEWFASKPDLAELIPKLRKATVRFDKSQELVHGPIFKHVHDKRGLSLPMSLQFKSYIQTSSSRTAYPSQSLMRTIYPAIDQYLNAKAKETSKKIAHWGFNELSLSPFTGKLMMNESTRHRLTYNFKTDPTVLDELGRPQQTDPLRHQQALQRYEPVLVSFDAPLQANSHSKIVIEYDINMGSLVHPGSATLSFFITELSAVFPTQQDVEVTVTTPEKVQPIIAPAPHQVTVLEDGRCRFETRLTQDATMLHLIPVNFNVFADAYNFSVYGHGSRDNTDLKTIIDKTTNLTVRPLLKNALLSYYFRKQQYWKAHQIALEIQREHPDFSTKYDSLQRPQFIVQDVEMSNELCEWMKSKFKSPRIAIDSDFGRLGVLRSTGVKSLEPDEIQELSQRVSTLDIATLDSQERMGRLFILCMTNVDTETNLAELLQLAEENPDQIVESLKMIRSLTIDKSMAIPFVLDQFDPEVPENFRTRKITTLSIEWQRRQAAYYALRSFRSPQGAKHLIDFIKSTEDSLFIQGAMAALSHMTLPEHFEELASISDQVAEISVSGIRDYMTVLYQSNPTKAVPLLSDLRSKYPKKASNITSFLNRQNPPQEKDTSKDLKLAKIAYQNSEDIKVELATAIKVLSKHAEPTDIAELKYRHKLPEWMNERLVSVIRFKGGDQSVFPFIEAYYLEMIQEKKTLRIWTCVEPFAMTGDKRAIPYLREIITNTERKTEAANAIGDILYPHPIKITISNDVLANHARAIFRMDLPEEERAKSLEYLLKDPEESVEWMLHHGRVSSAFSGSSIRWSEEERQHYLILNRFGQEPTRQILERSEGCSLEDRYSIARLLETLLPSSIEMIKAAAVDELGDDDRRRTAILALQISDSRRPLSP